MSAAVKCDRCHYFFEKCKLGEEKASSFSYTLYDETNTAENGYLVKNASGFDLCPRCTKALFEFLGVTVDSEEAEDESYEPLTAAGSLLGLLMKQKADSAGSSTTLAEDAKEKWRW